MGDSLRDDCQGSAQLMARLNPGGGRRLLRITAELTHRCNFTCPHCYCRLPEASETSAGELDAAPWERIIDEAAAEGALFLLVTGGEPLLHPGFRKIWVAAKRAGLIPELFTNGSLITPELADFLAEWPPSQVSVTVYGSTEEIYRKISGQPGMLRAVLDGLEYLRERQIAVEVKGLFSRINRHDFDGVQEICLRYNSLLRWSAELTGPSAATGANPREVGLCAPEIIDLELRHPVRHDEWQRILAEWQPAAGKVDTPFRCRVGQTACHINPFGHLQPCVLLDCVGYDLQQGSVREGWQALPAMIAGIPWQPGPCQRCDLAAVCRICPAHALRQGEPAQGPTRLHCALGQGRAEAFGLPAVPATNRQRGEL